MVNWQKFVVYFSPQARKLMSSSKTVRATSLSHAHKIVREKYPGRRIMHIVPFSLSMGESPNGQIHDNGTSRDESPKSSPNRQRGFGQKTKR